MVCKRYLITLLILVVHISTNFALGGLTFSMHVTNNHVEGTVSQICYLGLSFCFMSKNICRIDLALIQGNNCLCP